MERHGGTDRRVNSAQRGEIRKYYFTRAHIYTAVWAHRVKGANFGLGEKGSLTIVRNLGCRFEMAIREQ